MAHYLVIFHYFSLFHDFFQNQGNYKMRGNWFYCINIYIFNMNKINNTLIINLLLTIEYLVIIIKI